jgi:predicted secreted protein
MTTSAITGQALTLSIGGKAIAGSTNFTLVLNEATIDITSRDDNFQTALLAGKRDWALDVDALYVYTDVAKKILLTAANSGAPAITAILTMPSPDTTVFTGSVLVTSFNLAAPAESGVTYKCAMKGTGALTISAS